MANYKKNDKTIKVYIDFDGTITINDFTDEIFKIFGSFEYHLGRFLNKETSIFDYWEEFCKILPNDLSSFLQNFFSTQVCDPYFKPFLDLCEKNGIQCCVVTDNFDFIVAEAWKYYGFPPLQIYSNKLIFENGWKPIFAYADENCGSHSAVCKRNIILNTSSDDDIIIYIGDGFSDYQAAEVSDIIFAKNHLAKFCAQNRIPHHNWKTFFDVKNIMVDYLEKGTARKRHQASLMRKWVFEQE